MVDFQNRLPAEELRRRRLRGLYDRGLNAVRLLQFGDRSVERGKVLPRPDIAPGDRLLGLASSGIHSNGFSLVRKLVERSAVPFNAPAPFDAATTLGAALLTPTRIYVRQMLETIRGTGAVKALAHITGGGLIDNLPRVLPESLAAEIDLDSFALPPVFAWLQREAGLDRDEMLRTFNCGIGMIVIAPASHDLPVIETLRGLGEAPWRLGRLIARGRKDALNLTGTLAAERK